MTIDEGRPSEGPSVGTALVTALLLNTLKTSSVGSNRVAPAWNDFAMRQASRFTHGSRYSPRWATWTFCVTCVSPGTTAVVTT